MSAEPQASRAARVSLALLPLFFLSGCAALVYQLIWQRVLTFFTGADLYSVTLIVAAFMAGLGLGSLAGGVLADRLSLRARFVAFALAELGVAAFALGSLPLYYGVLYVRLGERDLPSLLVGVLLFLTLLVPTFLMGLSLPLLAGTIGPTGKRPEDWVGQLYGLNTLGAALGSLVAVWWLIRSWGFEGSVHAAAVLNLVCGLVALVLAGLVRDVPARPPVAEPAPAPDDPPAARLSFRTWMLLFASSGFVALSLEIVWFRLLGTILKSNAFTFATLLAVYLLGVGGGALLGRRLARGSQRPTFMFLALQALIPAYAALALAALVHALDLGSPALLQAYVSQYEMLDLPHTLQALADWLAGRPLDGDARRLLWLFAELYLLVPLFLFGPPTLLMGVAFPYLQKATQTDPRLLGRRVGLLQAANILGCALGAILTGLVLLSLLGSAATLRLMVALGGCALLFSSSSRAGRRTAVATLPAVLAALWLCPPELELWAALHGARPEQVLLAEDGSGLSVLKDSLEGGTRRTVVYAGGIGQSFLPYGGEHTLLGALPVLLHPAPRAVAIVGLGSGDTLYGAAARAETEVLHCIEIVAPQLETLRRLDRTHAYAGLHLLLQDARVHHVTGDGRAFLLRSTERLDVIEADALRPTSAFAGSLYSLEYFQLLRARLKPGGYAVSWGPTARIRQTFRQAFPHVLLLNQVLLGSEQPIVLDRAVLEERLRAPFTRDHFERGQIDVARLLEDVFREPPAVFGGRGPSLGPSDPNTDLFPRDEYLVPRHD